jgi:lipoprotein-anchoring transpeptidase ErfK/SrfK
VTTSTTEHKGQNGTYIAHAYVTYSDGTKTFLSGAQQAGIQNPNSATLKANVATDNRTVTIEAWGGITGAKGARFAVWSENKKQDDLIWYTASKKNGKWIYTVPLSAHKSTGTFFVHLYSGSVCTGGTTFSVAKPAANPATFNVDAQSGTFSVSVELTDTPVGISKVQIPIWNSSIGGQDDLIWHTAERQGSTNTYTVTTSTTEHKGQSNVYIAHVYATDLNGAMTIVGNTSESITHPTSATIDTPVINATGTAANITAYGGILGSASSARVAVWSANGGKNGQDDLIWYTASRKNGKWQINVPLGNHKSTGTFLVHVYTGNKFVKATTFKIDPPTSVADGIQFSSDYNPENGNFTVTANVAEGLVAITGLRIPIWGEAGGQNDLIWHNAALISKENGVQVWKVETSVPTHYFEEGRYIAHAYVTDANGASTFVGSATKDGLAYTGNPIITATLSTDGRTATITAGGGTFSKASSVSFPTWSKNNGQDDLIWNNAKRYGNAWIYTVPLSNHKSTGDFSVHVYATISGARSFAGSAAFKVAPPTLGSGKAEFVAVNSNTNTGYFAVHVPVKNGSAPIKGVRIAIWGANGGQNDLRWLDAHVVSGTVWGVSDSVRQHRLETGTYIAHVYVADANGASTYIGQATQTGIVYTGPRTFGTYIDVNLTTQYLIYYLDGIPILETPIVSGLPGPRVTPTGNFRIYAKMRNVNFVTGGFSSYWMPFYGGYGMHDATWQAKFGGDWYKTHGSHGCVNLPLNAAAFIYETAGIGTEVRIHY